MSDFEVRGAEDVDHLVRAIRTHASRKALQKELSSGLNRASKPIRAQMVDVIPNALPRRGGLAAQFQAKTSSRVAAKSGKWAGISVRFSNRGYDVRTLVGKRLRHPVFGNRERWVTQEAGVNASVFPKAFEKQKPELLQAVTRVTSEVARKVTS